MTKNLKWGFVVASALGLSLGLQAEEKAAAAAESKPEAAAEAAPKAEPVAKNDAPGSLKKGNALMDEGKWADAAAYFEGIGEQAASNGMKKREPFRLNNWSLALINLGEFAKAEEMAQKALDLKGDLAPAWNNLATAQANQGKRSDAVATLEKAIEAVTAAGGDTSKLESNLAGIKQAIEDGKPKAQKTAEAKAAADKAAADAKAGESMPADAKAADTKPADSEKK